MTEDRAVSLNAAIDAIERVRNCHAYDEIEELKKLPPVTPQFYPPCEDCNKKMNEIRKAYDKLQDRPTGHWIEGKYKDTCDKCRCTYPKNIGFKNYCPNCGCRMIEPQESEVNE